MDPGIRCRGDTRSGGALVFRDEDSLRGGHVDDSGALGSETGSRGFWSGRESEERGFSGAEDDLGNGDPTVWSWVGLGAVLTQLVGWALGAVSGQGKEGPGVQYWESFEGGGSCSSLLTGSLIFAASKGW